MLAVIFDFNGTMFFDERFQEISWRKFIENKTNRKVTDKEFQDYIYGRNAEITLSYFFNTDFSRKEIEELEEEKEVIYRELCLESSEFNLAKGLTEFLDKLVAREIPITIATASGLKNVKFFFEHLKLDKWFDFDKVVYNDGKLPGKPEPDLYLKAAECLGVNINNCIVFEDSSSGIESAKRANSKKIIRVASMKNEGLNSIEVSETISNYENKELLFELLED